MRTVGMCNMIKPSMHLFCSGGVGGVWSRLFLPCQDCILSCDLTISLNLTMNYFSHVLMFVQGNFGACKSWLFLDWELTFMSWALAFCSLVDAMVQSSRKFSRIYLCHQVRSTSLASVFESCMPPSNYFRAHFPAYLFVYRDDAADTAKSTSISSHPSPKHLCNKRKETQWQLRGILLDISWS